MPKVDLAGINSIFYLLKNPKRTTSLAKKHKLQQNSIKVKVDV